MLTTFSVDFTSGNACSVIEGWKVGEVAAAARQCGLEAGVAGGAVLLGFGSPTEAQIAACVARMAAALSAAYEDRNARNYNPQGWWQAACGGCSVEPSNFLMFFESSRKHVETKATLDYAPLDSVTVSLFGKYAKDNYPTNNYGLRNNTNFTIGPDVSWQATKDLSFHAYYTYQQLFFLQSSIGPPDPLVRNRASGPRRRM